MRFRVGKKLGDTLIEVTIAIGVFSLVAIVVISVISGSTSGAQANLETTVTREEMDSQAEALRFLQDAYLGEGTQGTKYANVWKAITANAINADEDMSYNPSTCDETLDDITKNHGFVINYRALGTGDVKQILLRPTPLSGSGTTSFETAKTYPRLLYGAPDSDSLIDDNAFSNSTTVKKAEGIYIIAVRDNKTNVAEGGTVSTQSAYYDFYIRSCWYAAGASTPSTISTVVRLYDPDVDEANNQGRGRTVEGSKFIFHNTEVTDNYNGTGNTPATEYTQNNIKTGAVNNFHDISKMNFSRVGYTFQGWCSVQATKATATAAGTCPGNTYPNGYGYQLPLSLTKIELHFFAIWKPNPSVKIVYNGNGATSGNMTDQTVTPGGRRVTLKDNRFVRAGHTWQGWCTKAVSVGSNCNGAKYEGQGPSFTNKQEIATSPNGGTLTLYAMWKKNPDYVIEYKGNGATGGTMANTVITGGMTGNLRKNTFVRTDYNWTGWCTVAVGVGASCTGTKYTDQKSITAPVSGGKLTLYAMWSYACDFKSRAFDYTGGMQSWTVPKGCSGTYQLEVWGAQGGTDYGGKGGYAKGDVTLAEGTTIYIGVGGRGNANGGWNGGGAGRKGEQSGGGGATHIGKVNNTIAESGSKSNLYIVAGGGGGGWGKTALDQIRVKKHDGLYYAPDDCDSYGTNGKNGCGEYHGTGGWARITAPSFPFAMYGGNGGSTGGNGAIPSFETLNPSCISTYRNYNCQEKFIRVATGGTSTAGGIGGIGTDHYDPPAYPASIKNGSGGFFGQYVGYSGQFGRGGGGFRLDRQYFADNGSTASGGYDSTEYQNGGGGGLYGGGAGAPTSVYASSGGGGSSYVGGVSNGSMTAAKDSTRTGNGRAVITKK